MATFFGGCVAFFAARATGRKRHCALLLRALGSARALLTSAAARLTRRSFREAYSSS